MSEDKNKKLATNRLLDILRSQGDTKVVDKDVPSKNRPDTDVETEQPPQKPEADIESTSESSQPTVDSSEVMEKESDEIKSQIPLAEMEGEESSDHQAATTKSKEISPKDLLSALNKVQSKSGEEVKKEEIPVPDKSTTNPLLSPSIPLKEKKSKPSEIHSSQNTKGPTTLLEQIQKPVEKAKPKKVKEIPPIEFDFSLLSTLSVKKVKKTAQDHLRSIFHLFNESSRRVTFHHGENSIRILQIKTGFNSTEIERIKEYVLPYKTDDGNIEKSDELFEYILSHELDRKEIKYAYGAYYSPILDTKTHILQAPTLNKKELNDLVDWNAKKNVPFSPDQSIINYEVSKEVVGSGEKHNIVIGISEKNSIEERISYFKESKLKPRLITTLPVLMWKLFLRNYPDSQSGCYNLIHMGEHKTTVTLVKNRQLLLTREILFGAEDFYKAAMQKVVAEEGSFKIDYEMAKQLLEDYGIPEGTDGVTVGSHISLYKLSIFLRPALERLTGELNRSMKYFTKQIPELEWAEMLFDGKCAIFPGLLKTLGTNLNVKVGLLNPMRKGPYHVNNKGIIQNNQLPLFATNFALASEEVEKINVIPKKIRSNYQFLFLYKVAAVLVAFLLPILIVSAIMSTMNIHQLEKNIETRSKQWDKLSTKAKEYIGLTTDIDILDGYSTFLENDRKNSNNTIKILKIFSTIVPKDIKITKIHFNKVASNSNNEQNNIVNKKFVNGLELSGFVQADASVSDIHLTNFMMKLEQLSLFTKIDLKMDETSRNSDGKLFFSIKLRY